MLAEGRTIRKVGDREKKNRNRNKMNAVGVLKSIVQSRSKEKNSSRVDLASTLYCVATSSWTLVA